MALNMMKKQKTVLQTNPIEHTPEQLELMEREREIIAQGASYHNGPLLLSARNVNVSFNLRGSHLSAIRGASLDVYEGETLAIVGESGSGKSVFTKTFLGMLDKNGSIGSGELWFHGEDMAKYTTEAEWLRVRGKKIAMVFQDPMTSLNPVRTIGEQIAAASGKLADELGVSIDSARLLVDNGYVTVDGFLAADIAALTAIDGIDSDEITAARERLAND